MITALGNVLFRVFGEFVRVALVATAIVVGILGFAFARVFAVTLGIPLAAPMLVAGLVVFLIARATYREHRRLVAHHHHWRFPPRDSR
jgi:hypothetical protein